MIKGDISACRLAFERWYAQGDISCKSIERSGGSYRLMQAHLSCEAFRAGWEACMEIKL